MKSCMSCRHEDQCSIPKTIRQELDDKGRSLLVLGSVYCGGYDEEQEVYNEVAYRQQVKILHEEDPIDIESSVNRVLKTIWNYQIVSVDIKPLAYHKNLEPPEWYAIIRYNAEPSSS